LIPVTVAAERLGVHEKTVRRWVRDGRLGGHRMLGDRRLFVDADDIEKLREQLAQRDLEDER
jgi:excisionase family DNA binding protein